MLAPHQIKLIWVCELKQTLYENTNPISKLLFNKAALGWFYFSSPEVLPTSSFFALPSEAQEELAWDENEYKKLDSWFVLSR